ncbi:MAG TPA: Rpn family recombination-promoting nuclease/putative transposase, partial [Caldilineaceae bacterium]|nr:Rpn family recombination-promoting nuclease/putative transposase [Caldilineaceae bacterium]
MTISNPHDRYFREIFSDPVVAQDLLRNYLPPAAVAGLDLTTLALQQESFIDEELRQHFTDLLYAVQQQGGAPAHVYILFEHKSYADRLTSFQLLRYLVRIWERMLRQSEPLT